MCCLKRSFVKPSGWACRNHGLSLSQALNLSQAPVRSIVLRIVFATALGLCCSRKSAPKAQTFGEWFSQKKTQKKYLLAQIAALETYGAALEKGYGIAKAGLGAISSLKQGDFLQQGLYFAGLKTVSPALKNNTKAEAIVKMEGYSLRIRKRLRSANNIAITALLTDREYADLDRWDQAVSTEADKDLATLKMLLTDQALIMTGQERLSQISLLYQEVRHTYGKVQSYCKQLQALLTYRQAGIKDAARLERFYEN